MGDLSTNYSRWEFSCPCKCGYDTVDSKLLELCEVVRDLNDDYVVVSSGCRCKDHNATIKNSSLTSQHIQGRAADLIVKNPEYIYQELCRMYPDEFGFGLYKTWIHVDSRDKKARWDLR